MTPSRFRIIFIPVFGKPATNEPPQFIAVTAVPDHFRGWFGRKAARMKESRRPMPAALFRSRRVYRSPILLGIGRTAAWT